MSDSPSKKGRGRAKEKEVENTISPAAASPSSLSITNVSEPVDKEAETVNPTWTIWTAGSYAFVMLLVGLPLWWKTTAVQRVPLPYTEMLTLHDQLDSSLLIQIPVSLNGFTTILTQAEEDKYHSMNGYSFSFTYTNSSGEEMDAIYKTADIYEIDKEMCKVSKSVQSDVNPISIYYVGRADLLKQLGRKVILGNCRSIYYISNSAKVNIDVIWGTLKKVAGFGIEEASLMDPSKLALSVDDELQLPLSAGYNILFSLLVPEPEVLDSNWKIEQGVKDYVDPMLEKLAPFAEFSVRSQILYYIKLNVYPKFNQNSKVYEVPYEQLPLVINPVESKLTSFVSQNPALNFLVYTAPCDKAPLRILDDDGSPLPSNAFLVPQWGGIFIYNSPCNQDMNSTAEVLTHDVSVKQVMSVMISQFRSLIGLPDMTQEEDILNFRGSALRDWEVDMIVRKRLRKLLFTAANTLNSLGKLLDQITNIVVTEEVGDQVEKSVSAIKSGFYEASQGKLTLAQRHAIEAFKASEIAFHHPKNLAQLYFPDDQKYAIYIPLFLPVGIPVLLSLRVIFKSLMARRRSSAAKLKSE